MGVYGTDLTCPITNASSLLLQHQMLHCLVSFSMHSPVVILLQFPFLIKNKFQTEQFQFAGRNHTIPLFLLDNLYTTGNCSLSDSFPSQTSFQNWIFVPVPKLQ
ncbi:hypothetical protein AQUCO_02600188v1 [Aquilegia coerulea]|uniref:Uncharacterized protein n=1 Tax=Aquilegia coerulea TaxID=218851 RepID=A0A2G5D7R5_AQUCA|nr:hypothetical protein AQUCO_02600188v1 [Aquilegia coerulea]